MILERYKLLNPLGTGGMGTVYKARDLLMGEIVALKRVSTPTTELQFSSQSSDTDGAVALAGEFRTLAGLHHPNIVAVLDYGFDSERMPYYTMQLLDGARPLVEAAQGASTEEKVRLLIDLLQALTYLHRHNVIHRDLKPANVLVTDQGMIKVLDFGLAKDHRQSMERESGEGIVGTLAYIAPEIFNDAAQSIQSDLYAVGVMACEMFTGHHPFSTGNIGQMISQILTKPPNLDGLDGPLAAVVARLLQKDPQQRYPSADEVIRALSEAVNQPLPAESAAVRESFLQASVFVGRDSEIGELRDALKALREGKGAAWLIGGESGVGKSRLMEEIRIRALVQGVLVLRGQAVAEGGLPYQFWRDTLRPLVLSTEITDFQAGVLKEIVPDISTLLGREIPDVPVIEGKTGRDRLFTVIHDVFKAQARPIVLLLEDAQWTAESLAPLTPLIEDVGSRPWLILVSYRDDEAPDLPSRLPGMKVMTLPRFSVEVIGDLSVAMLGESARRSGLVERLHEETEGNAFFLIEVVRALAEEAGSLSAVGDKTLPRNIITGGVLEITRRRLAKVPAWAQPTLKLAAVAGRQIDLSLLTHLKTVDSLDTWLIACANAAVLEVVDGRWRFAHDKLRETIRTDLNADERQTLHRKVAEAIETVYPDDNAFAEMLALHWEEAGDRHKATPYTLITAEHLVNYAADYARAVAMLEHGLEITPPEEKLTRAKFYRWIAVSFRHRSDFPNTIKYSTLALENSENDLETTAHALNILSVAHWQQGKFPEATDFAERGLVLAREANNEYLTAVHLNNLGIVANMQGHYDQARPHFEETLRLRRKLGLKMDITGALNNLGITAMYQGAYVEARAYLQEALELSEELGDRAGVGYKANNLAIIAEREGEFREAEAYLARAIDIFRTVGFQLGTASALANWGNIATFQGQYAAALSYLEESLVIRRAIADQWGIASSLSSLADHAQAQADYDTADRYAEESLAGYQQLDAKEGISGILVVQSKIDVGRGRLDQARTHLDQSLQVAREIGNVGIIALGLMYLALLDARQNDPASAEQHLREAVQVAQSLGKPHKTDVLYGAVMLSQTQRPADAAAWIALLDPLVETREENRRAMADLRPALEASLGAEAYAAAVKRGKALSLDEAFQSIGDDGTS